MGSIAKSLKRVIMIVVVIVAIVMIAMVAFAYLAPTAFGSLTGVTVGAGTLGGAVAAAGSVVGGWIMSAEALLAAGGLLFSSYSADKQQLEMQQNIAKETANAEAQVNEHFSVMEEDRYEAYDGPSLGNAFTRDVEKQYERDASTEDSKGGGAGLLFLGGLLVSTLALG